MRRKTWFSMAATLALVATGLGAGLLPSGPDATYAAFSDVGGSTGNRFVALINDPNACRDAGPDAYGYTCRVVAFGFEDINATGSSPPNMKDNFMTGQISLGFAFNFYGTDHSKMKISSNGFVSMPNNNADGCCQGQLLPNATDPNGVIAGYWEDLNPDAGGWIKYQTKGTSPDRRWIVQYTDVPHAPSGNKATFQIMVYESNNTIRLNYRSAPSDGGTHTAGIENQNGTIGLNYRHGNFSVTNTSVVFDPPANLGPASLPGSPAGPHSGPEGPGTSPEAASGREPEAQACGEACATLDGGP